MKGPTRKLEEMDDFTSKLIFPTVIEGGAEPPDENWLFRLKFGAVFTSRSTATEPQTGRPVQAIMEFEIVGKHANGDVKLYNELTDTKLWVPSLEFSRANKMRALLSVGEDVPLDS